MKRHWKLTAIIAGVLAMAGLGIGLAAGLSGPSSSNTTTTAAAQLTTSQQVRLERGITAPTVNAEASILAIEVRSRFEQQGKMLLPVGSHVSIDNVTFHALSTQLASVDASVGGPNAGRWQFILVRETGQWLLLGTKKLP